MVEGVATTLRAALEAARGRDALVAVSDVLAATSGLGPGVRGALWHALAGGLRACGEPGRAIAALRLAVVDKRAAELRTPMHESMVALAELLGAQGDRAGQCATLRAAVAQAPRGNGRTQLVQRLLELLTAEGELAEAAALAAEVTSRDDPTTSYDARPRDWADDEGWDRHFGYYAGNNWLSCYDIWRGLSLNFGVQCQAEGRRRIWIAGCGLSSAPVLLAALGLDVWASDISRLAIHLQREALGSERTRRFVDASLGERELTRAAVPGALHLLRHDFRGPWTEGPCDAIYNTAAIQGLPAADMRAAARVFHAALRPGGLAYVRLVGAAAIAEVEAAFAEAGFGAFEDDGEPATSDPQRSVCVCYTTG